jgi:hypothetical protein
MRDVIDDRSHITARWGRRGLLAAAISAYLLRLHQSRASELPAVPVGPDSAPPDLSSVRPIASFGPVGGDDDTETFNRWLQSGEPARFEPITYSVSGPLRDSGTRPVRGFGAPGRTIIRFRSNPSTHDWITLGGPEHWLYGISFDVGAQASGSGWCVGFLPSAHRIRLEQCAFLNNMRQGVAVGLLISGRARADETDRIEVVDCVASGNASDGIWLTSVSDTLVARGEFHHNRRFGLNVNPFSVHASRFPEAVRVVIDGTRAHHNGSSGINVGSADAGEQGHHVFDLLGTHDAAEITVRNVVTSNNVGYGVGLIAPNSLVVGCVSTEDGGNHPESGLAGFGLAGRGTRAVDCRVVGKQTFGFDSGALFDGSLENCSTDGVPTAFNLGSFENLTCKGLKASNFQRLLTCARVEMASSKFDEAFGVVSSGLVIEDITADITGTRPNERDPGLIVSLKGNPQNVRIKELSILDPKHRFSASDSLILALSDSFAIDRYLYNGSTDVTLTAPKDVLVVPDQVTVATIRGRPAITAVHFATQEIIGTGIAWWNVIEPARDLNAPPRVDVTAVPMAGQAFIAAGPPFVQVFNGAVVGLTVQGEHGRGYSRASARILPNDNAGTPGHAEAQIGVPLRHGARLMLRLPDGGVVLGRHVTPGGAVTLVERGGTWAFV